MKVYIKNQILFERWYINDIIKKLQIRMSKGAESWHRSINQLIIILNSNIAFMIEKILEKKYNEKNIIKKSLYSKITCPRLNCEKQIKLNLLVKNSKINDK